MRAAPWNWLSSLPRRQQRLFPPKAGADRSSGETTARPAAGWRSTGARGLRAWSGVTRLHRTVRLSSGARFVLPAATAATPCGPPGKCPPRRETESGTTWCGDRRAAGRTVRPEPPGVPATEIPSSGARAMATRLSGDRAAPTRAARCSGTDRTNDDAMRPEPPVNGVPPEHFGWRALPHLAQAYVSVVIVAGAWTAAASFPRTWPDPTLFAALLCCSCVTSAWKVTLPIPLASRATLSVSYAADLMALLLLGSRPAVLVAIAGTFTQCTVNARRSDPWYRTVFSMAAEALTMPATGLVYIAFGGRAGSLSFATLFRPLVGAISTYFFLNTGLVAGAIAMSMRQSAWEIWRDGFLWSGPSFMVAGTAGAIAAILVERSGVWTALVMFVPVYLTYRTYDVLLKRLHDQT